MYYFVVGNRTLTRIYLRNITNNNKGLNESCKVGLLNQPRALVGRPSV